MKVFVFSFPGQALGGIAVVKAMTEELARAEVLTMFPRVCPKNLELDEAMDLKRSETQVLWSWDGDY